MAATSQWIDVNNLSRRDLQDALALVPRLPTTVADRILAERPFDSDEDLLTRVNAGAAGPRDRLGKKLAANFKYSVLPPPGLPMGDESDGDTSSGEYWEPFRGAWSCDARLRGCIKPSPEATQPALPLRAWVCDECEWTACEACCKAGVKPICGHELFAQGMFVEGEVCDIVGWDAAPAPLPLEERVCSCGELERVLARLRSIGNHRPYYPVRSVSCRCGPHGWAAKLPDGSWLPGHKPDDSCTV